MEHDTETATCKGIKHGRDLRKEIYSNFASMEKRQSVGPQGLESELEDHIEIKNKW